MKLVINSELSLKEAQITLAQKWKKDKFIVLNIEKQQRTFSQGKSIHLYCKMLAYELTSAGYDIKKTLKEDFEIPWDMDSVKQLIWHPVQFAMFGTKSTAQLTTDQVSKVYDVINRKLSTDCGVGVLFPSRENM